MWTKETLKEVAQSKLNDRLFVVVSNREPYVHTFNGEEISCRNPVSGMALAIDPIMKDLGGVWVAHGGGDADKEVTDEKDRVMVPPDNPLYTLKRVWFTKEEEEGYYYGFSNQALWPLSHAAFVRPIFSDSQWEEYKKVNKKFAQAVLDEVGDRPAIIFIQDYHLTLLPKLLKESNPDLIICLFWHVPWPNPEVFNICPYREELLDGLLGSDLLCFHIQFHCNNFLETCELIIEAKIDWEDFAVVKGGKTTAVRPFPISVDYSDIESVAKELEDDAIQLRKQLGLKNSIVGLGVDRIDYIKGIPERFRAIDRFFEKYQEYQGRVTFVQLGAISRIHLQKYKNINEEITDLMIEINHKYRTNKWLPIRLFRGNFSQKEVITHYRMSDFLVVSSLHDGMNLVAKEYVSSCYDNKGTLVLSRFTGASKELVDAIQINPYAIDAMADNFKEALEMPEEERLQRMIKLRENVSENNIYKWMGNIISEMVKIP